MKTTMPTIDAGKHYNLMTLPEPIEAANWVNNWDTNNPYPPDRVLTNKGRAYLWSGDFPIPAIGSRVTINYGDFGTGTVDSYFVEHGWLGVRVKLDNPHNPPDWHMRQIEGKSDPDHALIWGAGLAYPLGDRSY